MVRRAMTPAFRDEGPFSPDDFADEKETFTRAFCKNEDGSWTCKEPATLHPPAGRIQVAPGTTFYRGTKFMGFDVAEWLEAHATELSAR
jgi:hypothetical protein